MFNNISSEQDSSSDTHVGGHPYSLDQFLNTNFREPTRIIGDPLKLTLNDKDYLFLHLSMGGGSFKIFGEDCEVEPRPVFALYLVEVRKNGGVVLTEPVIFKPYEEESRSHMIVRPNGPINWTSNYTFNVDWEVGGHFATGIEKKSYYIKTSDGSPVICEGVIAD